MRDKKIEVKIDDISYSFVSQDNEEYLQSLAKHLNEKLVDINKAYTPSARNSSRETRYLLLSVNVADEYFKALKDVENLKSSLVKLNKDASANIGEMGDKSDNYKIQINRLKRDIADKQALIQKIEEEKKDLRRELDDYKYRTIAYTKDSGALSKSTEIYEKEINLLKSQIKADKNVLNDKLEEISNLKSKLENNEEAVSKDLQSAYDKIDELETDANRKQNLIKELQNKVNVAVQKLDNLTEEYEKLGSVAKKEELSYKVKEEKYQQYEDDIKNYILEIEYLTETFEEVKSKLQQNEVELKKAEENYNNILNEKNQEIFILNEKLKELEEVQEKNINELKEAHKEEKLKFSEKLNEHDEETEKLKQKIYRKEEVILKKIEDLKAYEQRVIGFENSINFKDAEISTKNVELEEAKNKISILEQELEEEKR